MREGLVVDATTITCRYATKVLLVCTCERHLSLNGGGMLRVQALRMRKQSGHGLVHELLRSLTQLWGTGIRRGREIGLYQKAPAASL